MNDNKVQHIDRDAVILKLINELEKSNNQIVYLTELQKKSSESISNIITKLKVYDNEILNLKKENTLLKHQYTATKKKYQQMDIGFQPQMLIKTPIKH